MEWTATLHCSSRNDAVFADWRPFLPSEDVIAYRPITYLSEHFTQGLEGSFPSLADEVIA